MNLKHQNIFESYTQELSASLLGHLTRGERVFSAPAVTLPWEIVKSFLEIPPEVISRGFPNPKQEASLSPSNILQYFSALYTHRLDQAEYRLWEASINRDQRS